VTLKAAQCRDAERPAAQVQVVLVFPLIQGGIVAMPTPDTDQSKDALQARESFDLFKFYEEAVEKTKTHIWSQTGWILSLSTAVPAFSVNLYLQHHNALGAYSLRSVGADLRPAAGIIRRIEGRVHRGARAGRHASKESPCQADWPQSFRPGGGRAA